MYAAVRQWKETQTRNQETLILAQALALTTLEMGMGLDSKGF